LKSFHDFAPNRVWRTGGALLLIVVAGFTLSAKGELPAWIRNIEAKTDVERAFFRAMQLPYGDVVFRRPPAETRPALGELIQQQPANADLYSLAALEDERRLDFPAAEKDWKLFAEKAANKAAAQLDLADFYHRRLRPQEEIAVLRTLGNSPATPAEKFTLASQQSSWNAFERILGIIQAQALGKEPTIATYRTWIARYPGQEQLYVRFLDFLVTQKEFEAANQLIASYQKQFSRDEIFPVKARALVEYRQGSIQQGLAVYEKSFQPLWQPELVKGYFDLLAQTQGLRKSLDEARAALNNNPEDLNATARIFYYYQQQGKLDAAQQAITNLRLHKETAKSSWTPQELYVCGRLLEDIHSYPEAARYYFALYSSKGAADSQERALTRLTDMLLTSPESPIRLGSGELSMYKDIATMDPGPGYLNGILSLVLNTTSPGSAYPAEELRAFSYFHRSRATELLALLDKNFPNAAGRPGLHVKLLEFYSSNGESEAMLKGGKEFLASFPKSGDRTRVALLMADADARLGKPQDEFAIYDAILEELAKQADNIPLGISVAANESFGAPRASRRFQQPSNQEAEGEEGGEGREVTPTPSEAPASAFQVGRNTETRETGPRSPEYARVLERYLARLVQLKEVPRALGVLRREIDHNPDDPGLYERLATFLQQNNLSQEEEEVYRRAFARFSDPSWYSKLARLYLRYQKYSQLQQLTQDAVKQFDGNVLETYFASVGASTPAMYVRLNQYANARFPHNPYFVNNLLEAYHSKPTYDQAAWLALIRQHWFEDAGLRNQYFEYLSSSRQLEHELNVLRQSVPRPDKPDWAEFVAKNPAAATELADAEIWRSHFEQSAPVLKTLSEVYPAEQELDRTASSVFRSLAYFDPSKTAIAAKIEENLLAANPGNTQILARIGDIYSDRDLLQQAAPYWERIPKVSPGESRGYLDAATIYWDYFDFNNALRLLDEGRKKLDNPTLYGYEEGAIYETRKDYPRAISEYAGAAVAAGGESAATGRLAELARRPKLRDLVNDATEKLVLDSHYALPAVNLRLRVLEAANRAPEMATFLSATLDHAKTIEQAAAIEAIAQQRSLESVRQKALEKQAALATDPVTRIQLRYALVRFYESKKDFAAAQRNIEALYQANPKILGVVRSTVDFYWRVKLYPQAIAVLRQAAKDAYPQLSAQFTFEAARKSTEAKDFQQARTLLDALLKGSPYDSQFLAAMADTYAQAGDAQGLKQFYLDKIGLLRNAPLAADERKNRIATLRRGLIPALTQRKDYPGAVDQYIELINNFPEDEGLLTEAALYSRRYQREKQLLDFYSKTIQQSPRDYRWSMVLARIEGTLEDFPAAIDSYGKAIAIRPDRSDLRIARATLEERLLRFDDAASDYDHLYQLAYKDPKWMEKIAEVRARQGRSADAVAALRTALIDVAPERAANYFEVARRLEAWGILEPAKSFAEEGVSAAGDELLATSENHDGAKIYMRLMTRLRQHEKAWATLQNAMNAASNSLPVLKEQVAKKGISAIPDKEWREHVLATRQESARNGMHAALVEMGSSVARYFTPEEKVTFSSFAQALRAPMPAETAKGLAIPLVEVAGLADREATWRYELLMNPFRDQADWMGQMREFVELQRQRLKFAELGPQLESFATHVRPELRSTVLLNAAEAYRSAGDSDNELRLLSSLGPANLGGANQTRWFTLLLKKNPQQLVQVAGSWSPWGQPASDFVLANGDAELAHAVVTARGNLRPPVWSKSYTALVGLYFAEPLPPIKTAFVGALGDQTIGERIGKSVDRDKQLAGDIWYYYASRYGEYLANTRLDTADDFLAAESEHSPASSDAYLSLGDYYLDHGDVRKAIEQYEYTLELSPARVEVHDKLALAYYKDKNRTEAIAQWKVFFAAQLNQVNNVRLTENFWADFGRALDHVRTRGVFHDVKPEIDQLLRAYLRRNGNYRSNALLDSAYLAQSEPVAATAWLLDLSMAAPDPTAVLEDVVEVKWIPIANRAPIFQRILEAKLGEATKAEGLEQQNAKAVLWSWQLRWVKYLVDTKQYSQAADEIARLRKNATGSDSAALVPYEMQCAAKLGTLDTILSGYKAEPETSPSAESLRIAARQLFDGGDKQSARKILEFVFARQLEEHQLVATNFLGLAEIRIADGDVAGAVALLKRLVLVAGDAYQNMDSSAALFEKTGHPAEAIVFLEPLANATPWEPSFRLRLGKAQLLVGQDKNAAAQSLAKLSASTENPYALRVQAAAALAGFAPPAEFGSVELKLLAAGRKNITPAASDHPYFYDSRLAAAENAPNARVKMEVLAKALADSPSREDARVPLFRVAISIPADELALSSIEQLLKKRLLGRVASGSSSEEEIIGAEEDTDAGLAEVQSPSNLALPPSQQSQLAHEVALAMIRLDRLDEAASYLKIAQKLEKSPAERTRITSQLLEVKTHLRRQRTNATRQPILHAELEQDRLVRPRLVARADTPAKAGRKP
jgi:tetratricopeptide (TPR) repeat protein/Flp pilus assembly protein TadD